MERRHEQMLMARLEEAAWDGCAHITDAELHLWYGVRKVAAASWRDLMARWDEVVESALKLGVGNPGRLMKIGGKHGIFIFGDKKPSPIGK